MARQLKGKARKETPAEKRARQDNNHAAQEQMAKAAPYVVAVVALVMLVALYLLSS